MDGLCLNTGLMTSQIMVSDVRTTTSYSVRRSSENVMSAEKSSPLWGSSMNYPFRSLWPVRRKRFNAIEGDGVVSVNEEREKNEGSEGVEGRNVDWVMKILQLRSLRKEEDINKIVDEEMEEGENNNDISDQKDDRCGEEGCDVCDNDDDKEIEFDKDSFSKMLRRVNLPEARLYAQMSHLGQLAYSIPQIKPRNLLKDHGFHFVTSSLEQQEQALEAEKEKVSTGIQVKENGSDDFQEEEKVSAEILEKKKSLAKNSGKNEVSTEVQEIKENPKDMVEGNEDKRDEKLLSPYVAYRIAASAASYLQSRTTDLLPFRSPEDRVGEDFSEDGVNSLDMLNNVEMMNGDMASLIATTDSVTSVVAAKEEVKQAVADDLNSTSSTPCEWFVCDDDLTTTRFFVIQGSDSLASWQANLFFEPIQFEGLDVLVHRGIYEAAKGIYKQMLPEVHNHVKNHGDRAIFRFTGHSLGGSLSLLVNLMLLIRGDVPRSSLLPVVTFGSPSIMCGGDRLLRRLGLPRSHVQSIAMHRDIVPRAFSCNYPNHVTDLLKAVNGRFRGHPCLQNNGLLYFPMGEFLILQPDEKFSPHHELLPSGIGLYLLKSPIPDANDAEKHVRAALAVFLNTPHPLEILSDRSSYGSDGAIVRDHDLALYLNSINDFIRQELNQVRKTKREHQRKFLWPLIVADGLNGGIVNGRPIASSSSLNHGQFNFAGVLHTGRESLRRLGKLFISRHMHLLLVFLLPARIFILAAYNMINFY